MSILIKYVDSVLIPTDNQITFISSKAKKIHKVLMNNSLLAPKEIHLGGSLKRDTMLRYKLDADIIYIYNRSEDFDNNWKKLINTVYKPLETNFPNMKIEEAGNLAIHIITSFEDQQVKFDIVPCYYVNSPKMMEKHTKSKLYKGITTIWHSRYLTRYKNLPFFTYAVRLLKDWKQEQDIPLKNIHLELIVADIYNYFDEMEQPIKIENVLLSCFEDILDTIDGYPIIPFNWRYCNENNYEERYSSPVLIDPANPYDNLLKEITIDEINIIFKKTKMTIENLQKGYYKNIFNRKELINYAFKKN
jgi:hypothetical protein